MFKNHTLAYLLNKSDEFESFGDINIQIKGITYNSKKVSEGFCFVAIKGDKFDGHSFIQNAIESGAKAIICQIYPDNFRKYSNLVCFIRCENSRKLLAQISNAYYEFPSEKLKIIGITGTNGKTTSTFLLKSVFEQLEYKCGIIGTTGIFIGNEEIPATHTTPESLELFEILAKMYDAGVEYVAMEVSSHSLIQYRVYGINFVAAIFTNLTHDHLDYHKTIENYASAKKLLFESLDEDSIAVVNSDSEWSGYMTNGISCKNIIRVGRNSELSDVIITNEKVNLDGISYTLHYKNSELKIHSKLTGKFNIENSSLIASVCLALNVDSKFIQDGLLTTDGAPGRMQRVLLRNSAVALIDYAHTPDALEKALLTCKNIILERENTSSKLICVFGCGGDRDKTKRPEMGKISSIIADVSIVTSDNPRTEDPNDIINNICEGINDGFIHFIIPDREKAIEYAFEISKPDDIILIAGKGHEKYQIIGTTKIHFDDYEVIAKFS